MTDISQNQFFEINFDFPKRNNGLFHYVCSDLSFQSTQSSLEVGSVEVDLTRIRSRLGLN